MKYARILHAETIYEDLVMIHTYGNIVIIHTSRRNSSDNQRRSGLSELLRQNN